MDYYIAKDGSELGPYPEGMIEQMIFKGKVSSADLCWKKGMVEWATIGDLFATQTPPPLNVNESVPPLPFEPIGLEKSFPNGHPTSEDFGKVLTKAKGIIPDQPKKQYIDIKDVPWVRRSSSANILILVNFFTGGIVPGILVVCITLITGDIYYAKKKDDMGCLKTWSFSNKVLAFILTFVAVLAIIGQIRMILDRI